MTSVGKVIGGLSAGVERPFSKEFVRRDWESAQGKRSGGSRMRAECRGCWLLRQSGTQRRALLTLNTERGDVPGRKGKGYKFWPSAWTVGIPLADTAAERKGGGGGLKVDQDCPFLGV